MLINPYNGVNWANQWKANLHTHTSLETINDIAYGSDGSYTQQQVIDLYYNAGYKILSLTDHDDRGSVVTTYPWSVFGRDPSTLGMLAIEGRELSYGHHVNSWFNNLGEWNDDTDSAIAKICSNGGIAQINHPGRYGLHPMWYVDLYLKYSKTLIAIEVHNQGDRYPNDRTLWDIINASTIPFGKVVYGTSNDDMHGSEQLFRNYQHIVSEDLSRINVFNALKRGASYFSYESGGSGEAKAPRITNIVVDEITKTITITADSGTVKWISEGTVQVGTGITFEYSSLETSFVRAEITNAYGITYTQPFAFVETNNKAIKLIEKIIIKEGDSIYEIFDKYIKENDNIYKTIKIQAK